MPRSAPRGTPTEPLRGRDQLRRILNWGNLSTPLGLALARARTGPRRPGPNGTIVAVGYHGRLAPKASAITIGDVILVRISEDALSHRPELLTHERRHSEQWALCLGVVAFPALYGLAALWSLIRVGNPAQKNLFECRAGLSDGGYSW